MGRLLRYGIFTMLLLLGAGGLVNAQTANFTASPTSGCAPLVVQFTNTSTGTMTSQNWSFGNSSGSVLANPSTTYTAPGVYTVTLTVYGPGGPSTKTSTITVYAPPTISFTRTPSSGCPPLGVQFTSSITANAPGGLTYYWVFGDGNTSTAASPFHVYTAPNTYSVSLTVTNGAGCSATLVQSSSVTVFPKPIGTFTAGTTTYCQVPATVNFIGNASGTGPFSYYWEFGDGGNGTGNPISNTYTAAGTYTVKMVVTGPNGCTDTVTQNNYITTHSSNATFTGPNVICMQENDTSTLATFTNTTPGSGSTTWLFGDGGSDTGHTTSHRYLDTLTYTVRMITMVGNCADTAIQTFKVHPPPTLNFTWTPHPSCPAPATHVYTPTGASTYSWTWSKGGSSTLTNPSHYFATDPIADTVTLTGTDGYGCVATLSKVDTIYDLHVRYSGPIHGCAPFSDNPTMTIHSTIHKFGVYPATVTSWHWDFGDGTTSTADSPLHTYLLPGDYNRVLTYTTSNGCTMHDTVLIHVGTKVTPSFTISPDTVCPHVQVYFHNTTPSAATSTLTYTWDVGQGYTPINNRDAATFYFWPTTYTITLYSDNNGCVDSTKCVNCVVVRPANANFVDSAYCSPQSKTIAFKNLSVGATSQFWDFGDGNTSTAASPVHTYATTGFYNVTLRTTNNIYGCSDTMVQMIHVTAPVLSFTAQDTTLCKGDSVRLTATYSGPPARYEWVIDNQPPNPNDSTLSISRQLNTTGYHSFMFVTVKLVGGCRDTVRRNNYVIVSKPAANFGATPVLGCAPLQVLFVDSTLFTPGTASGNRTWTFGGGGTASNNQPTTSYTYPVGTYTVKLKVTDWNGCSDSLTRVSYIRARHPVAAFSAFKTSACIGEIINFTNSSSGATGLSTYWSFGDGDSSTAAFPTHAYRTTGTFTVRLIVKDSTGCVDTLIRTNYINISKPTASFTLSDTVGVCPPLVVHLASTSINATSYAWDFGNTNTAVITNPTASYAVPGVYTIRLIAKDAAGCTDTSTANVRLLGYAGAFSYAPLVGCAPLEVTFNASVTNVASLVWDFSDGVTMPGTGATTSHLYLTPGAYVPKLIFSDSSGCSASSTGLDTIKVDGIDAGFKTGPLCEKTPVVFTDTSHSYFSAVNSWLWNFGNPPLATGATATRTYPAPGTYPVTLIVSNTRGCKDTISSTVTINALPIIKAMADTAVCIPDAIALSATGGVSYTWSPGATLSCTACPTPNAAPTSPTNYIVIGTDANGCAAKDTVRVGIQTKTTSITGTGADICLGQKYQLSSTGSTIYSWSPAATLTDPNIANPVASPTTTTTYTVVSKEGSCIADTHTVKIVVLPLPKVDAGSDVTVIAGNSTILTASGTGIHHVYWDTDPTLSCTNCFTTTATPKITTTYIVTAYTDRNCIATDSVRVKVLCDGSQLFIPNTFTPNGDGANDYFFPRARGIDHIASFRVYSRWGELLFERANMPANDERSGWNGTYNGQILNPDVYVYVVEASCDTGEPIKIKGDITLIR